MKKIIHKADERGFFDHDWLKTYHSFSFAQYFDRSRMNFGMLRVLNDDTIDAGKGFGLHPHDNMEIVTIMLQGSIKHRDSMGNEGVIQENEIQSMSAGSGIMHSEFNPSPTQACNLLQIWVMPKEHDIEPRYEQLKYNPENKDNNLMLLVSPDRAENSMFINQDAYFYLSNLDNGKNIEYKLKDNKHGVYIFVIEGNVEIENEGLNKRDAIGIYETENIKIKSVTNSELLLIEVPMTKN